MRTIPDSLDTYSKNSEDKPYYKYRCSTYNNQGKTACSYHAILEDELKAIVLMEIQKFSKIATVHVDEMLKRLIDINCNFKLKNNKLIERQTRKTNKELKAILPKIDVLLCQMVNGNMSESMFKKLMGEYERKQIELTDRLTEQKAELSVIKNDTQNIKHLIECFKKRVYIEELDRETIVELIDYIRVFKKKKVGKEYLQRVDIYFNFIGQVEGGGLSALQKRLSEDTYEKTDQTA